MFRKDKIKLNTSFKTSKKKEKPKRIKVDVKKPSFGKSFVMKGSMNKAVLGGKAKSQKSGSFFSRLKWWHILLVVLAIAGIVAGIVASALIGKTNDPNHNDEEVDDTPIISGTISSVGTFEASAQDYVLCEYIEYFSGENVTTLQKSNDIPYNGQSYWVFINETGNSSNAYKGALSGNLTPEEIKEQVINMMSNAAGYTPEKIAQCDVHVYEPVSFTSVVISSATIAEDGSASIKYKAGALDGEMSEEYELIGTYTKTDNAFAFSYESLPEDETLIYVLDNLLMNAVYESKVEDNYWANKLVFGGSYELTLIVDSTDGE